MNYNMPRTPFSTHLSGSAKETEIRLKNIFSGPKKRPPVLFLILMFCVCMFCGNLVSCQMAGAEEEPPPASVTVDPDAPPPEEQAWTAVNVDVEMLQNNEHTLDGLYDGLLTDGEATLLENLPADQLPREAVEVFQALRQDYWRDTLLPVAFEKEADLTVYFVVNPDSMPNVDPSASPMLWGDLERRGIVLRYGGQTKYFPLCWEGNAHYASNPRLLVDDLDGDGQPEAALVLCLGGGTGAYEENLYIFDLDTMVYTVPDYSEVPLEITASPRGIAARLVSGEKEWEVKISELGDRFTGRVEVGNVVRFLRKDGRILCELEIDFTCDALGYLAFGRFPVVYEDGVYKLGPAEGLGDVL